MKGEYEGEGYRVRVGRGGASGSASAGWLSPELGGCGGAGSGGGSSGVRGFRGALARFRVFRGFVTRFRGSRGFGSGFKLTSVLVGLRWRGVRFMNRSCILLCLLLLLRFLLLLLSDTASGIRETPGLGTTHPRLNKIFKIGPFLNP